MHWKRHLEFHENMALFETLNYLYQLMNFDTTFTHPLFFRASSCKGNTKRPSMSSFKGKKEKKQDLIVS
jgi:hypothetical protein